MRRAEGHSVPQQVFAWNPLLRSLAGSNFGAAASAAQSADSSRTITGVKHSGFLVFIWTMGL